jgi:hypothetical protein
MPRQYTPRLPFTCLRCGKETFVKASHAPLKRYCSKTCQDGPRLALPCATCEKMLSLPPNRGTGNHYCNQSCRVKARRLWDAAHPRSKKPEQAELRRLYESEGMVTRQIASHFGVSHMAVKRWLRQDGILVRPDGWNGGVRWICDDGHRVRSSYEQRVDNWLNHHAIDHTYEPVLPCDRRYHADFLANGWYIEVWGVRDSPRYVTRRNHKRALYAAHNLPLIQISYAAFDTAHSDLWVRLLQACVTPAPLSLAA